MEGEGVDLGGRGIVKKEMVDVVVGGVFRVRGVLAFFFLSSVIGRARFQSLHTTERDRFTPHRRHAG